MNNEVCNLVNIYIRNTSCFYQFQVVKDQNNEDDCTDTLSSQEKFYLKLIENQEKVKQRYKLLQDNYKINQVKSNLKLSGEERLTIILKDLGLILAENGTINIPNNLLVNTESGNNSLTNNNDNHHQLEKLKRKIKQELKKFDSDFQMIYGKIPSKSDKEPLKPLYILYKQLKDSILQAKDHPNQDFKSELESLKERKTQLRGFLETYQDQFLKDNHRKVLYHKDLLPIEKEYFEYKSVKNKIKQLEDLYSC